MNETSVEKSTEKPASKGVDAAATGSAASPHPTAEGWWWRYYAGQWVCGLAKLRWWNDDDREKSLTWDCGVIILCARAHEMYPGAEWYPATPPARTVQPNAMMSHGADGSQPKL